MHRATGVNPITPPRAIGWTLRYLFARSGPLAQSA